MASSYFKLKVLKRKRSNSKINDKTNEKNSLSNQASETDLINVKKNKCRICLLDGSISIFGDISMEIRESIRLFGGIEVSQEDSFPEYLCNTCYSLLQNAILFRQKAQETNSLLKKQCKLISEFNTCSDDIANIQIKNSCNETLENYSNENDSSSIECKKYKCEICNTNCSTLGEFVSHNNLKQHKKVRIQCPICKGLLTTQLYKKHLARHQSASHLVCDVCGKMYRKDNLVRHLQLHSYELPYQCKVCPYRGRFPESLKIHMRTHTGQKPFSCDKCQLHFLTKSNLNRHLLTHNKLKPFKCSECSRGFHTKRDMIIHYTGDHVGIKSFCCKTCNNKYGTRKALMRHELRVHKREKMAKGRMPLYLQAEYNKI